MKCLFVLVLMASVAGAQSLTGVAGANRPAQAYAEFQRLAVPHAAAPFLQVNLGDWKTSQSYDPCIPDPATDPLVLLFSGMGAPVQTGPQRIGRATIARSAFLKDPGGWVEDPSDPVLVTGTPGQPDSNYIRQSSCLYNPDDGGKLYEYYTCNNGSVDQMCLAISSDQGHTWTKYGVVVNPAIDGCSDETWVSQGAVMRRGKGDWIMVYSWRNPGKNVILPGTRYMTSTDGKTWHGHGTCANSLTVSPEFLEQHQIFTLGGKCVLLYETGNYTTTWTIHSAVASICEGPFTVGTRNPFLAPTQARATWDAYQVATPWYFVVNGVAYLIYSGTSDSKTDYNLNHYPLGISTIPAPSSQRGR